MVGINRAGPSGAYLGGHIEPEPAPGRAHGSSSGASSSNSPHVPSSPSDAPASPPPAGRERLPRSRPLSRQTREWLEQGMPTAEDAVVRRRPQAPADPATPRAHAERRNTRQEHADAAAPHAQTETRRTPQTPAYARAPQHQGATAHAESIVQQLVGAGADLAHTRTMLRNAMNGNGVAFSRAEQTIFLQHFPNMPMTGISPNSELAVELRGALRRAVRQQAAEAPARAPTPARSPTPAPASPAAASSASSQRSLFGRFARLMAPNQGRSSTASNASTSRTPVDRSPPRVNQVPTRPDRVAMRNRGNSDADAALRHLDQQGVNMGRLHTALGAHIMHGRALPEDLRRALRSAGIRPYNETSLSLMDHPLLNLNIALNRRLGPRPLVAQEPRPAVPMGPASSPRRPRDTRAATLPVMPEREDHESNVSYGMRLLDLNPGVRVQTIVDAFIAEPARRPDVVAQMRELRAAAKAISSQFSQLRTISKADAASEELGFKDAADHHPDDATHCLFGEPLSLGNKGQRVIGLAAKSTDTSQSYSQEGNKELVFMDMKKLAQFLAGKPEHPMNRERLDAETIAKYAFRIAPDRAAR